MSQIAFYESPLGTIRLTSTDDFLTELKFIGDFPASTTIHEDPTKQGIIANLSPVLRDTTHWLDLYFAGQKPDFIPPYKILNATPFRARVNELIARIPYGETLTYSDLARQISEPDHANNHSTATSSIKSNMSAQAIGGAVGWNPICLIVPCHRVLGANCNLTGYAGGIERKLRLLTIEHHDPAKFTFPKPRPPKKSKNSHDSQTPTLKTDPTPQSPNTPTKSPPIILQTPQAPPTPVTPHKPTADTPRCRWLNLNNPTYVAYHDTEWAVPDFDDHHLFECIVLESFQAGLSWECVLSKREGFRAAYSNFDLDRVCAYDDTKIAEMSRDPNIIRNPIKIAATVDNARIFRAIREEFGTFYHYLCTFTGGHLIYEIGLTKSALSDRISADLQRRGMKFTGSTIIYSYMQATGIIQSHDPECFLYKDPALYNPPNFQI